MHYLDYFLGIASYTLVTVFVATFLLFIFYNFFISKED